MKLSCTHEKLGYVPSLRKWASVFPVTVLVVSLAACGGGSSQGSLEPPGSAGAGNSGERLSPQAASTTSPVFRFAKISNGAYFFTGDENEKNIIARDYPDFRYEGIAFNRNADGSGAPVYRFANLNNGGYFYTANPVERDIVQSTRPDLRFEGSSFSVSSSVTDFGVTRLANLRNGAYLYTASSAEAAAAVATGIWRAEGLAFYAPATATQPPPAGNRLSAGSVTLALKNDGTGVVWGSAAGAEGRGPQLTTNARRVVMSADSVSIGRKHGLALGKDGKVYGWGDTDNGLLETYDYVGTPSVMSVFENAKQVYASQHTAVQTSFVLKKDGTIWHMPGTVTLQPNGTVSMAPKQVPGVTGVTRILGEIDGGIFNTAVTALRADGTMVAFGIGTNDRFPTSSRPIQTYVSEVIELPTLTGFVDMSCEESSRTSFCLGVKTDGKLYSWSFRAGPTTAIEVPFSGGTIRSIAAFGSAYAVLTADKRLWTWGLAAMNGQGLFVDTASPTLLASLQGVEEIATTALYTGTRIFARLSDGSIWGWGTSNSSFLGGIPSPSRVPARLPGIDLN